MSDHRGSQPGGERQEGGKDRPADDSSKHEQPHYPPALPPEKPSEAAEQKREFLSVIRAEIIAQSFSGPLPHPDILAKFEQVLPGAADRILSMAEKQSKHRQALEKNVVEGDSRRAWAGAWMGFVLGLVGLVGAIILGLYGHPVSCGMIGVGSLAGLAGVFVYGTISRRGERQQKAEIMSGGKLPPEGQKLPVPKQPPS